MRKLGFLMAVALATAAQAERVEPGAKSVVETVKHLKAGQFVWAPGIAPAGPVLLIVNVQTQRAVLYRNGVPIGATTVSTGKAGHSTPTGVFSILQKQVEHYSSKYDSAPMPYMQRLTWYGVALHAGKLPGYPASHGCIRLPAEFAKLLYGVTKLGMTIVVADRPSSPRLAVEAWPLGGDASPSNDYQWQPQLSPAGPVSIIVSIADKRAVVLRNGVEIGSAVVTVDSVAPGTWAYELRSAEGHEQWIRLAIDGNESAETAVPSEEWQRFHAPDAFRSLVASIVEPGTTVVVTGDSLVDASAGSVQSLIESEAAASQQE
ncbi:L,D-transpeptidase family protein [Sphingomonas alba]|uniref:L,D-transpeptidase family protein n=1 Tax=Sphingomonas alba TaxID=2908208 RepID=A0ABT0RPB0_9SPHN|nr:L,D-transpeptidase family protein [Sphingomonas alba]MCL6684481.1 L,D-transpeptidase family protein [Sphingomonas alba]